MSDSKIIKTEMVPFKLTESCGKCETGEIIRDMNDKIAFMSMPMQFPVICTNENCDYKSLRTENDLYPKVIFDVKNYRSMFEPRQPLVNNDINLLCNKIQISNKPEDLYFVLFNELINDENTLPSFLSDFFVWSNNAGKNSIEDIIQNQFQNISNIHNIENKNKDRLFQEIVNWSIDYKSRVDTVKNLGYVESNTEIEYPDFSMDRLKHCNNVKELFSLMFKNTQQDKYEYFVKAFNTWINENDIHTLNKFLNEYTKLIVYEDKELSKFDIFNAIKKWVIDYRFNLKNKNLKLAIRYAVTLEELYKLLFQKEFGNDTPSFIKSINHWLGGNYELSLNDIVNEYIQDIIKIHSNENSDILRKYIIECVLRYEKQSNNKSTVLQPNRSKKQLIERIKQCVTLPELYYILFQNTEDKYYFQFLSSFDNYILEGNPKIINDLLNSKCYGIIITDNIGDNHYTAIYNTIKDWCFNYRENIMTKKVLDNKMLNVIGDFAFQIETFENKSKSDNFLFEIGNKLPNLSNKNSNGY